LCTLSAFRLFQLVIILIIIGLICIFIERHIPGLRGRYYYVQCAIGHWLGLSVCPWNRFQNLLLPSSNRYRYPFYDCRDFICNSQMRNLMDHISKAVTYRTSHRPVLDHWQSYVDCLFKFRSGNTCVYGTDIKSRRPLIQRVLLGALILLRLWRYISHLLTYLLTLFIYRAPYTWATGTLLLCTLYIGNIWLFRPCSPLMNCQRHVVCSRSTYRPQSGHSICSWCHRRLLQQPLYCHIYQPQLPTTTTKARRAIQSLRLGMAHVQTLGCSTSYCYWPGPPSSLVSVFR